jgi:hypothetical protein
MKSCLITLVSCCSKGHHVHLATSTDHMLLALGAAAKAKGAQISSPAAGAAAEAAFTQVCAPLPIDF